MNSAKTVAIVAPRNRRNLRDFGVMIVWAAGFFGAVEAADGVTMAICMSLITLSATYLAFRGRIGPGAGGRRKKPGLGLLFRAVAWVTLGPIIAAFLKLQMMAGFGRVGTELMILVSLGVALIAIDRLLAGRA